jgi:hypothetical protein
MKSTLQAFMYDEMLENRITMIARLVYKTELTDFQIKYIKYCIGLMSAELNRHLNDIEPEIPTTAREGKIIESITASYISAVIKLVLVTTELEQYRKGDLP